jgi:enediyne biosynthesis protein E4
MMRILFKIISVACCVVVLIGCDQQGGKRFRRVSPDDSGITFRNDLTETVEFNIFNYMYFYNGGGVAVGDLNGDELPDLYFTSNQGSNELYLNQGNLKFKNVTEAAGVEGFDGWATGVTMADVNSDGKLDIYVSYIGDYLIFNGKNQLFINEGVDDQGVPRFVDRAIEYGLDLVGFSTQASFFDYDNDGDLDMFMLNLSLHQNGTFGKAGTLRSQVHPTAGDKLLRNENGHFIDVTKESGIYSSVLGYGLGVVVSDVNLDGWPDIFVGNDFHENDYLYINQGNGTFVEGLDKAMNHTSRYTMGVDFADFNNDAYPDLIAMDMLPGDYKRLKASAAEDPYDVYTFKIGFGYNEQYTRNVLQLNNHDGTFSDIALYAGVAATDWSWATLFADFDLDGNKDIFVSNGILRRSNDLDYINFITVDTIQRKMQEEMSDRELRYIQKMPKVKIQNFLFANNNDSTFTDKAKEWGLNEPSYSNGAVYADLDNDGDLDLVTNNVDEVAFLYENRTIDIAREEKTSVNFLQVELEGTKSNINGIGSKVFLYTSDKLQMQECMPTRGFQSAVESRLTFGTNGTTVIDSLLVIWNDGTFQKLSNVKANQKITLKQADASGKFDYGIFSRSKKLFQNVTNSNPLNYKHKENKYVEFVREGLVPFMLSAEGPALSVGDINQDGLEDLYLGGGKWQAGQTFIQSKAGAFVELKQPMLKADSTYEDVNAVLFDADNDQDQDLFVVSGGNEFSGKSKYMKSRLYLNDGKGLFNQYGKLPELLLTGSCAKVSDLDKDGDMDIFLGARAIPWKYGIPPDSYILLNDGAGNFTDATAQAAPELKAFGFIKDATWSDMDNDGDADLVIAAEWKPITIFYNNQGKLKLQNSPQLEKITGWWNSIVTGDFDKDGDLDMLAGNLGLNSKLKTDSINPVRLYVNDFDKNDSTEQILTHVVNGIEYPFYTRDEMTKQIPSLKKKYLSYQKFSEAKFSDFFPKEVIEKSRRYVVNTFESVYFENKGKGNFEMKPLPVAVQLSTVNAFLPGDFNKDGNMDVLVGGNFFRSNIQMGRYDASFGQVLTGDGKGNFKAMPCTESGFIVKGETRKIAPLQIGGQVRYMVVRNNDTVEFFTLNE